MGCGGSKPEAAEDEITHAGSPPAPQNQMQPTTMMQGQMQHPMMQDQMRGQMQGQMQFPMGSNLPGYAAEDFVLRPDTKKGQGCQV